MMATTLRSCLKKNQRQQRAHARGGQRGKNRDGMDEALVQHAQHDVDGGQRRKNQQRHHWKANSWKEAAVPWKPACTLAGIFRSFWPCRSPRSRLPARRSGARLNETVIAGNWPWWLIESGSVRFSRCVNAPSGTALPAPNWWLRWRGPCWMLPSPMPESERSRAQLSTADDGV